eukprot:c23606_g1_i1 orf=222-1223(+)
MVPAYPHPDLEVTLSKAKKLKNVNWKNGDLRAYAIAWVDPEYKVNTGIDEEGDTTPKWEEKFTLPITRPLEDAVLTIEICHDKSSGLANPLVGVASLRLKDVADAGGFDEKQIYKLNLVRPSGRPQGKLKMMVRLRDRRPPPPPPSYSYPSAPGYGQGQGRYPGQGGQSRDWQQGYPSYTPPSYPQYGRESTPPSGYAPQYAAAPPGYPSVGGYNPYSSSSYSPAYGSSQPPPYNAPQSVPYYVDGGSSQSAYGAPPQATQPSKGSKIGGFGTGLAVGALAGAVGGIALDEIGHGVADHFEEKGREEEREREDEEDDALYTEERDDYWDNGGF